MIISFWRYCHLALALASAIFVFLASVTGAILAFEPVVAHAQIGAAAKADGTPLAQTVQATKDLYLEVYNIDVDENGFVSATILDDEMEFRTFYINPKTGEKVGEILEQKPIFRFATNLHRSLFLKSVGRFFVGLSSLLLLLIAVSGVMLIVKRQQGIRHFFKRILREGFFQYFHILFGRWMLVPIIIITVTGVYLSLVRFEILPTISSNFNAEVDEENIQPQREMVAFPAFKNVAIKNVRSVEFPFSAEPEDFYRIELLRKEILVHQFSGEIVGEQAFPFYDFAQKWSTEWHTGRGSILWSTILFISCLSLLFFIYSGFAMTLKRRKGRIKNKFKKDQCDVVILVGSESGSTMKFAKLFHQQLLEAGRNAFLAEMNRYQRFKKMEQLVVFAATYGVGEPPANAKKFAQKLKEFRPEKPFKFSVVGFGSLAYTNFCQYAFRVDELLAQQKNATRLFDTFTINNRSWEAFNQWVNQWGEKMNLAISVPNENPITQKRIKKIALQVAQKTRASENPDDTFLVELKTNKKKIKAGDLLAIYPNSKTHERLYSVGVAQNGNVLLSVKRHAQGLCSNYLNNLKIGEEINASWVKNKDFRFPKKAPKVLMISTGTGIAPFLGMLQQNTQKTEIELYWGGRSEASLALYREAIETHLATQKLTQFVPVFSRASAEKNYVQHQLLRNKIEVARTLQMGGTLMICGSIAMQKEVTVVLETICQTELQKPLSFFQNKGRLKMDCY